MYKDNPLYPSHEICYTCRHNLKLLRFEIKELKRFTLCFILLFTLFLSCNLKCQTGWTQKADFIGQSRHRAAGFSIDSFGFIGTGIIERYATNDFWKWNSRTNVWTRIADFPGGVRSDAIAFSIGNKGYVCGGFSYDWNARNDFWEYDPTINAWTQKANLEEAMVAAAVFVIGNKAYVVNGNSLWEYDPSLNSWAKRKAFPGVARAWAAGFSIGTKGYLVGGQTNGVLKDFWEWDQSTNSWTRKQDYAPSAVRGLAAFSIGNKGYVGADDYWEWDETRNSWVQIESLASVNRESAVAFIIGGKGYVCTGGYYLDSGHYQKDLWEYQPCTALFVPSATICAGQSITLTAAGANNNYTWSTGATMASVVVSPTSSTIYTVSATGINNCIKTKTVSLVVNNIPTVSIAAHQSTICSGQSATLFAMGAGNYTWSKGSTSPSIVVSPSLSTTFTVQGVNYGCAIDTVTFSLTVLPTPTLSVNGTPSVIYCGNSVTLTAQGADNYQWNTGETSASFVVTLTISTSFTVVGNSKGCSDSKWLHIGVFLCTGVEHSNLLTINNIKIYPNPLTGILNIKIDPENTESVYLSISNILGENLLNEKINDYDSSYNLSNLQSGIYFITLKQNSSVKTFKMIKE